MLSTMSAETNLSTLSLAILGLIAQKAQSGYDVRKMFSTTPMGHFSSSPGAIYPALKRIESNGWVRGRIDNKKTLRPKLVYKLTKKGQDVLRRHLLQTVTRDDVIWHMDDLMLRFAFMGDVLEREETLRFLKEFVSEVESYLLSLRQYLNEVRESMPLNGKLAMKQGIDSYKMNATWAKGAIKEFERNRRQ